MAPVHPLQGPLDSLPDYLTDARNLYSISVSERAKLSAARRLSGSTTGAGRPGAAFTSINRGVVVASVGALEAFNEDLALTALPIVPGAAVSDSWYDIAGRYGMVQTPSPWNLGKMYWTFFRYDPRNDWELLVGTAWSEVGPGTNWRGTTRSYRPTSSPSSDDALNAMVKVRHGFAHQDSTNRPPATPGVVGVTSTGKLSLQSHHAFNSMSMVAQVAVLTAVGLAAHTPHTTARFKWRKAMTTAGIDDLLVDTPAARVISASWESSPF